jgi:Ca2+-binding RTX toxin-like protein
MANIMGTKKVDIINGTFLSDTIYSNNGDDTVAGELVNLQFVIDFPNSDLRLVTGSDFINGGKGNDVLGGDYVNATVSWLADTINEVAFFGHDTIYGDKGDDVIAGDIIDEHGFQIGMLGAPPFVEFTIFLGHDLLFGGNGNDTIAGDQGMATIYGSNAEVNGTVYLGNDALYGGNGKDKLIGDSNSIAHYENGVTGFLNRYFGNDSLDGGGGNDILIGDAETNIWTQDNITHYNATQVYGNDVLKGGLGNDILWGDYVTALSLPGGVDTRGHNTFVYNLSKNEGHDIVMDFLYTNDSLMFTGVKDVNRDGLDFHDVDAAILDFAASGDGALRVDFKSGTSIVFETIAYDHQMSIADIVASTGQIIV